jgi:RHS repeat-associated protein
MEWDSETGLYRTSFRYYDTIQGRWMSVDPLPGDPSNPDSSNRYAYVLNDPANLIDPLGLQGCPPGCIEARSDPREPAFTCLCPPDIGGGDAGGGTGGTGSGACNPNLRVSPGARPGQCLDVSTPLSPPPQPPSPPVSVACKKALQTAGTNTSALKRITDLWASIQAAADYQNIDPSLLASIAIRETGAQNRPQIGGGGGQGVFQLDSGTWGTPSWAYTPQYAAVAAAYQLSQNLQHYGALGVGPQSTLAGAIRAYNAGYTTSLSRLQAVDQTHISAFLNRGTAGPNGGNYVSNVMDIFRECFK